MANPKTIYCPSCGRRVATYDGRSTMNVVAKCKKCQKRIVYYADTGETELKSIPQRATGSGMTFY